MKLVILESPREDNADWASSYARECLRDSLSRGEVPISSQALADEYSASERIAWHRAAKGAVFYVDNGWSGEMVSAMEQYDADAFPYEIRTRRTPR